MERRHGLNTPSLALGPLLLGPDDDRLVRGVDEAPAGRDLDAVAAGLDAVEEEARGDRMLGGRGLDLDAGVEPDVGRAQALLAGVHPERGVVQPAVLGVGVAG